MKIPNSDALNSFEEELITLYVFYLIFTNVLLLFADEFRAKVK